MCDNKIEENHAPNIHASSEVTVTAQRSAVRRQIAILEFCDITVS